LAIVHGGYLGDGYREEMEKLYVKYRGAELDAELAEGEKLRLMQEWWMMAFEMLTRFGLTREMIQDVAMRDVMMLRDGAMEFLNLLNSVHVPLKIVSAGLGNVIVSFLEARDLKLDNVDVVANWLRFDEQGLVNGCGEPIIHSANKTQLVNVDQLGDRRCVLLLGDTLEDADMVADFEGGTVIRVGFLNGDTENMYDAFADVFDVVVGAGGGFDWVHDRVKSWMGA
jgi:cytosolic 5'-nucleotidase 3